MKQDKYNKLLEKLGAFWAFGDKQYNEQAKNGTDYCSLGDGLICPKEHVNQLIKGIKNIQNGGTK